MIFANGFFANETRRKRKQKDMKRDGIPIQKTMSWERVCRGREKKKGEMGGEREEKRRDRRGREEKRRDGMERCPERVVWGERKERERSWICGACSKW